MGDSVRGPEIAGIELDGAAPGWLRAETFPDSSRAKQRQPRIIA
jgi:hypothetical protein